MLSEERIKLMTRTAAYEEHEGKRYMSIGKYFRSDYLELHVIKSLFYGTIAFVLVVAMTLYYQFETFLQNIYKMDMIKLGRDILRYYIIFMVANAIVSYIVYSIRYSRAKKSLKRYNNNLKKISSLYESEGTK
ncbi:MAG: hypothetical protein J6P60_06650 [Lachnospiraceae bacterium]|nr:hypothetical protein [Lachnospiraceae bacterium]